MPSWAGAISIDLLPAVLIFILCIVQAAIRNEEGEDLDGNEITANEMIRAVRLYKQLGDLENETGFEPDPDRPSDVRTPETSDHAKVTTFPTKSG